VWGGQSARVGLPGGDAAILGLLAFYGAISWLLVVAVRHRTVIRATGAGA
jgi:hypothetical protein